MVIDLELHYLNRKDFYFKHVVLFEKHEFEGEMFLYEIKNGIT